MKHIQQYDYFDGEDFIYFDVLSLDKKKMTISLIVQANGRITHKEYDLFKDKKGIYFEYDRVFEKIYLKDFKEVM